MHNKVGKRVTKCKRTNIWRGRWRAGSTTYNPPEVALGGLSHSGDVRHILTIGDVTMATWRKLLLAFVSLSLLNLSLVTNAHITSSSYSYLPDLRPRASSTTSTLDCTQTTTSNVSACYPNLNKLPICCVCGRVLTQQLYRSLASADHSASNHVSSMSPSYSHAHPPTFTVFAPIPPRSNCRR